jgi:hypothetical protein
VLRYGWLCGRWLIRIKTVDFPNDDVVGLGSLILISSSAGDDDISKECETIDIVGVQLFGEEVRVVDSKGLVSSRAICFKLLESWHRPETYGRILTAGEQPTPIWMKEDGHDRPFVTLAGEQSHARFLLEFWVQIP